jgi:hypothetical protein
MLVVTLLLSKNVNLKFESKSLKNNYFESNFYKKEAPHIAVEGGYRTAIP